MSLTSGFCLGGLTNSKQFSEAMRNVTGDGACEYQDKFGLGISGFSVSIAAGFALALGRWLKNDEALQIMLPAAGINVDRYDAAVARVDEETKKVTLEIVGGVDPEAVRQNPVIQLENGNGLALYLIRVRRGADTLSASDVTDVRRFIKPLSEVSAGVLRVYHFTTGGIDLEVERLVKKSAQVVQTGTQAVAVLNQAIQSAGGTEVGELMTSAVKPGPVNEWLLCDGSDIPAAYPGLGALLGGNLPNIAPIGARYQTYIYAGIPVEGREQHA